MSRRIFSAAERACRIRLIDDVMDLPVMRVCGLAIAIANAPDQVLTAAQYITPNAGGPGAARDAVDFVLQAHGILDQCIDEYLNQHHAEQTPAALRQ